jgi:uncharacterized membrane protein
VTPGRRAAAPSSERTTTGLEPNVAAVLSYLGWWPTGIVFLLAERHNRFVRFHAAQSLVAFGAISALVAMLVASSFALLVVSDVAFQVMTFVSQIVLLTGVVLWLLCLWKAFRGERWALPGVARIADRLARD